MLYSFYIVSKHCRKKITHRKIISGGVYVRGRNRARALFPYTVSKHCRKKLLTEKLFPVVFMREAMHYSGARTNHKRGGTDENPFLFSHRHS